MPEHYLNLAGVLQVRSHRRGDVDNANLRLKTKIDCMTRHSLFYSSHCGYRVSICRLAALNLEFVVGPVTQSMSSICVYIVIIKANWSTNTNPALSCTTVYFARTTRERFGVVLGTTPRQQWLTHEPGLLPEHSFPVVFTWSRHQFETDSWYFSNTKQRRTRVT